MSRADRKLKKAIEHIRHEMVAPNGLEDEWMDYAQKMQQDGKLSELLEQDLPVICDGVITDKNLKATFWDAAASYTLKRGLTKESISRDNFLHMLHRKSSWRLHAVGVQDGNSFHIWRWQYSFHKLGLIVIRDRTSELTMVHRVDFKK